MADDQVELPLYKYEPLSAPDAVRVLALSPSTDRVAPLTGDIIQYSRSEELGKIDTSRIYSAVSYVWGESRSFSHRIVCNPGGSYLSITSNVDSMLRHFRHPVKIRYLWLDAICLNQIDEVEKGVQIPLMGDIYRQAKKTLIWLGEDDKNEAPEMFALMRLLSIIPETLERKSLDRHMEQSMESRLGADWLERLDAFLQNQWFFRRWTIQEAVFSHNSVVRWGNHSLDGFRLISAFQRLDAFGDSLKGRYAIKMLTRASLSGHHLLELLWTLHRSECSDKRDRILAIYGLLPETQRQHIDYRSHWSEIFLLHAKVFLSDARGGWPKFFMLHLFSFGAIATDNASFPSWVPDWSGPRRFDFPYLGWSRELDIEPPPSFKQSPLYFRNNYYPGIWDEHGWCRLHDIILRDNHMVFELAESSSDKDPCLITRTYKNFGTEVSTRSEAISVLEPLLQLRAWKANPDPKQPSTAAMLIASMLIYHGVCKGDQLEVSLKVESCLIDYSNPGDPAVPHHDNHLPLMTGFCNLLQSFSLFQMAIYSTTSPAWGFGHHSLQEGDELIPLLSPEISPPRLQGQIWRGPAFRIMAITRPLQEDSCETYCRHTGNLAWNSLMGGPEGGAHHDIRASRSRYIGPSFCIVPQNEDPNYLARLSVDPSPILRDIYIV